MGRGSRRRELLQNLHDARTQVIEETIMELLLDDDDLDEELEEPDDILSILEDISLSICLVNSSRYLKPRRALDQPDPINDFLLNGLEDSRFKQEFRMSRSSFRLLCDMIRFNPVFLNKSNNPQRPVEDQLMVTLKRLGCYGKGASVGALSRFFRLGEGTIELYTNRVIMAILSLQKEAITWPTTARKQAIKDSFGKEGFDGCIGIVDGTLIRLHDCPKVDGADFFSHKGHYGIVSLVICDHNRMITYLSTGWPGCSHDQRLMDNSCISINKEKYFNSNEYLLADSGFVPTKYIVPAYKQPAHGSLTSEQHRFNNHLAQTRVRNEHCISLLKGRFQSLKSLRLRMAGPKDVTRAAAWIKACATLHNLLIHTDGMDEEDMWIQEGQEGLIINDPLDAHVDLSMPKSTLEGCEHRKVVQDSLFSFLDS